MISKSMITENNDTLSTEPNQSSNYRFPHIDLPNETKIWLEAACSKIRQGKKLNPSEMLVELWGQISEDFNYKTIDQRLMRFGVDITLLGILHIDPTSDLISKTDQVIAFVRTLIINNPAINDVTAEQVARGTKLSENEVAIIFNLISHLGMFWNGALGDSSGYSSIHIEFEEVKREYLKYKTVGQLIDRFYREKEPAKQVRNLPNHGLSPQVDEYLNDQGDSPHLSPKLIIEKSIIPSLTIWVSSDGQEAKVQRWYDVTPEVINNVGIKSVDFIENSLVRLVDKDGQEIHSINAKLNDEFDGLPILLARIEKTWSCAKSATAFWHDVCQIILRSQVPSFKEILPDYHMVARIGWLELSCFWIAFLARIRNEVEQSGWGDLTSGDQLIQRYISFYNESPSRGPKLQEPSYQVDRVQLQALADAVRQATSNSEKKQTLESLAEYILSGVAGFEVLPNRMSATGEIDRVVRNNSTYPTLSRLKSPILVECKHWKKTVGTDPVGAFILDLQDAKLASGFLFSQKPISKPARRRIENFYQRQEGFIIVITERDIEGICDGGNLVRMIIEKTESIMFQRQ